MCVPGGSVSCLDAAAERMACDDDMGDLQFGDREVNNGDGVVIIWRKLAARYK